MQFLGINCPSEIIPVLGKAHTCISALAGEGMTSYNKLEESL